MPSETVSPSKRSEGEPSSSGGVFSWLSTSARSPTYGTAHGSSPFIEPPLPLRIRTSATGSNSSVTSGSPSSRSSASGSPASKRRFIMPTAAFGSPGGRMGGRMVTLDISPHPKNMTVKESEAVDEEIALIQREYAASPSSRTTYVKTVKTEEVVPSDNQTIEYTTTTTRSPMAKQVVVTTTTSDNQEEHLPLEEKAQHVQYITKTVETPGTEQHRTVRYVTTTASSPVAMGQQHVTTTQPQQQNVQYVTKTITGVPQQQQNVQYITKTIPASEVVTKTVVTGQPQAQNVQYVTKTITQPSTVSSPSHHVQYVTSQHPVQANQQTDHQVWMVAGQPQQVQYIARSPTEQKVQYVTKTITHPGSSQTQVQNVTTTKSIEGSGNGAARMTAGMVAPPPTPAVPMKLVDGVEGLPPPHFIGVHRPASDVASSDGEDPDMELVFDIMSQKFKPVRRGIVTKRKSKVVGSNASSSGSYGSGKESGTVSTKSGSTAVAAAAAVGLVVAGSGAIATASAKNAGAAAVAEDLEGKGPVPPSEKANTKTAATAANGAAATVAAIGVGAAAGRSSPMMKLDTVAAPASTGNLPASGTPGALKKRTPSQTKDEPSPRKFFGNLPAPSTPGSGANAPSNPARPDPDVALTVDEPAPYTALRSPSHHDGSDPEAGSGLGLLLRLRVCNWFSITLLSLAVIVLIMVIFYRGVTLRKYQGSELATYEERYDVADKFNGYLALFSTFFAKPIELLVAIVLPMVFLSLFPTAFLKVKLTPRTLLVLFSLSWLVSYLLSSGFHAINVQLRVDTIEPVISLVDLSLSMSASASLAALAAVNMSSNASFVVTESGVGNAVTNTVLRNIVALDVDADASTATSGAASSSTLLCSNTPSLDGVAGLISGSVQSLSTTTVGAYGFPSRTWQEEMLPGALPEANVSINFQSEVPTLVVLPMKTRTAADLVLHAVHVSRDVFRWFDVDASTPLGVQDALMTKYTGDDKPKQVSATDLLDLTTPGNAVEEALAASSFLKKARTLVNNSLAGAENVSRSEASLEFSTVVLPNGFLFESVTLDIPLIRRFLSRQLKTSGNTFIEDPDVDPETARTFFYDLDIANDCGPYAGVCEVRKTEFDAQGNVYEPPTTVRAFSLCTNSQGTDLLEVVVGSAVSEPQYTCTGTSGSSMLVVSVSSKIVGDALVEGPSTAVPRLVAGLATIVNPRKVYSLTVGKLSWAEVNLALRYQAACAAGVAKCTGLDYALGDALKNATEALKDVVSNLRGSAEKDEEKEQQDDRHLIVGADFLPLRLLSPFKYNATEVAAAKEASSVSGWPLVSITKPLQVDSRFENDGDLAVPANFQVVSWKTAERKATQCSATVEARLASVLDNHLYIENGVQPAYTSALFFLFQDAVTKTEVALATGGFTTLSFALNVEFISLHASIPLLNVVLTGVGCGLVLLASLVVFVFLGKSTRRYGILSDTSSSEDSRFMVSPEGVARIKLDRTLFPRVVLERRIEDSPPAQSGESNKDAAKQEDDVDTFTLDTMRLQHDDRDHLVATGLTK